MIRYADPPESLVEKVRESLDEFVRWYISDPLAPDLAYWCAAFAHQHASEMVERDRADTPWYVRGGPEWQREVEDAIAAGVAAERRKREELVEAARAVLKSCWGNSRDLLRLADAVDALAEQENP